jgi:hypothetical protein
MKIYIVTQDLGDGDVGLRYFPTSELAQAYIDSHEDDLEYNSCWHDSNPHELDIDSIVNNTFKYNS